MSEYKQDAAALAEMLAEVDRRLPDGRWEVATSNSFRRINGPDGRDGGVLHALTHRDGQPDLSMDEEQLRFLCHLRNQAPALAQCLRGLVEENERLDRSETRLIDAHEFRESQINDIADALGDEGEWSNLHDRGNAALELATALTTELAAARASEQRLRDSLATLRADCMATYLGGYHAPDLLAVFQHGMATVCNVVNAALDAAPSADKEPNNGG